MYRVVNVIGRKRNEKKGYTTYHCCFESKDVEGLGALSFNIYDNSAQYILDPVVFRDGIKIGQEYKYKVVYHYDGDYKMILDYIVTNEIY